jgi:hypothetical protein
MNTSSATSNIAPPKLIPTFVSGFDTVANRIGLILFPLALDLFLWFGPHLSLKNLLQPVIDQVATLPGMNTPDMADLIQTYQASWRIVLENFNLAIHLRTYPVGIPSAMATLSSPQTPLGVPPLFQVPSVIITIILWLGLVILGLIGGSLFFNQIARAVSHDKTDHDLHQLVWSFLQVIGLTIALILILTIIAIPTMMILPIFLMINPGVAQIGLLLILFILVWLLLPLFFSPHGVFILHQNALTSILTSARLVRFLLPGSLFFFLSLILLGQGMDLLWHVPPPSSWMNLVGIAGHAFVTTSLFATSFVYYRDAMTWVQEVIKRNTASQKSTQI